MGYGVNSATLKFNPLRNSLIPHSDDQVLFSNTLGYQGLVIGDGKRYRRVKGSPIGSEVISEANDIGIHRRSWRIFHLSHSYLSKRVTLLGKPPGIFING